MTKEKEILLSKINFLIEKRKSELIKELPSVHEIDDGIVIRFFTEWDNCDENNEIKYKRIVNENNPNEKAIFFFLPKGSSFEQKKRDYVSSITCLNGKLKIDFEDSTHYLESNTKMDIKSNVFQGSALENTYILTTNKI